MRHCVLRRFCREDLSVGWLPPTTPSPPSACKGNFGAEQTHLLPKDAPFTHPFPSGHLLQGGAATVVLQVGVRPLGEKVLDQIVVSVTGGDTERGLALSRLTGMQ